jgi:hypothetical protein
MDNKEDKMKKLLLVAFSFCLVLLSGCTKVGDYKEGTHFGSVEYESYGVKYVVTANIYVDEKGVIKSCFIDSTYNKDGVNSTKKTLGDNYGMKNASAQNGVIEGGAEWYEQVKVIEDKVVKEQGLAWVKWSDEAKTKLDSVSGVTIAADVYIEAVQKALDVAK